MKPYKENIEKVAIDNNNFRRVLFTAKNVQLVVMSLLPGEEIGDEVHDVDQFFRFEKGNGKVIFDEKEEKDVSDGDVVIVPAGTWHNIINVSKTDSLKLYTLYCPPHHLDGTIHMTKEEAEKDEEHFDGTTTK